VLAIIPGPKEPANLAPYLKPLLLDLEKVGPDGEHLGGLNMGIPCLHGNNLLLHVMASTDLDDTVIQQSGEKEEGG
jgi:hypothetical protein